MFELVEAAFDTIVLFVELSVVLSLVFAVAFGWDHRLGSHVFRLSHDGVRVIAFVGDHGFGPLAVKELRGRHILASLARGDAELQRKTVFVGQQVDLRAQTSSGTPQSRVFGAPFLRPVAACWCARTMVESIIRY